jgi:hypothetical protein
VPWSTAVSGAPGAITSQLLTDLTNAASVYDPTRSRNQTVPCNAARAGFVI